MSLEDIVNKIKKEKKFGIAASTFIASRITDVTSTSLCFSEFGQEGELNPVIKYFTEFYGAQSGLILENTLFSGLAVMLCYYFNQKNILKKADKYLYIGAAAGFIVSTSNFWQYFMYK